jgi:hypothetical protein
MPALDWAGQCNLGDFHECKNQVVGGIPWVTMKNSTMRFRSASLSVLVSPYFAPIHERNRYKVSGSKHTPHRNPIGP